MCGAVMGGGIMAMLAESLTDSTTIQIGLVGGIAVGVFYAGAALQKLKDGQRQANARLSRIEKKLNIDSNEEDDDHD